MRDWTRLRAFAGACGVAGAVALFAYFVAPLFVGWPYAGGTGSEIASFALPRPWFFFAGAWLQSVGATLSVVFLLALVALAGMSNRLEGLMTIVGSAALLAVVLVETSFLIATAVAAEGGDTATVGAAFTMVNGVFMRVYPLAPAPLTFIGIGLVIRASLILPAWLGSVALALGGAFVLAGVIEIFSFAGVIAAIVLGVGEGLWIAAASIALLRASS